MIACDDAKRWLAMQPDGLFAGVVTDPPETISVDVIPELLRVSSGPVLVLAPLVWAGEPFPRSMRLPIQPEAVLRWWVNGGPLSGGAFAWGSIYAWKLPLYESFGFDRTPKTDPAWEERSYNLADFFIDGFPGANPIDLFKRLCELIGDGQILDPFAGSGPTAKACEQLGLGCTSVDSDSLCCDYIRNATAVTV